MQKFDVQIALEGVAEARREWNKAVRKFNADVDKVMTRLLHEAAANFMSAEQVAKHAGLSPKRVRSLMRLAGLNPRDGKRLLAKHAAEALASNAELLGIAPHEMDLMSPLAYLPMGSVLRQQLTDKTISQVTELPDDLVTIVREDGSEVAVSGNAIDSLARLLCGADGKVNWTDAIPAKYRDLAATALAAGWHQ